MVCFTIWEMHGFSHEFPIVQENCNKTHFMGRTWEIGTHTFPIVRFLFYGILYYMGNACVFSSISHNMGKDSQTHGIRKA